MSWLDCFREWPLLELASGHPCPYRLLDCRRPRISCQSCCHRPFLQGSAGSSENSASSQSLSNFSWTFVCGDPCAWFAFWIRLVRPQLSMIRICNVQQSLLSAARCWWSETLCLSMPHSKPNPVRLSCLRAETSEVPRQLLGLVGPPRRMGNFPYGERTAHASNRETGDTVIKD